MEQEVDHLKTKFNVLIPVAKEKESNQVISDTATADSGQWTDSDDFNGTKPNLKKNNENGRKIETKNDYNYDQNMKNEEEFIYVPAIHPPPNFSYYVEREQQINELTKQNKLNPSKRNISTDYNESDKREEEDESGSGWPHTQNLWIQNRQLAERRGLTLDNKPTVVDVHPKQKYDESMGADRDDYETILHWNHRRNSEANKPSNNSFFSPKKMSISMNQINAIKENFKFKKDSQNMSIYPNSQNINNFSFNSQLKSFCNTSSQNLSQSNECLYSRSNKKKNIRSSLQSYFFSGCSTLKQNKKYFQSIDNIEESTKSFPLPKTYRKNFINKGHSNCGLYSGDLNPKTHKNLSDDLKSVPHFDQLSALVHKEIADATKEISGWL